jgi:hypothetical protein
MTTFHQIQALGKETVYRLARVITKLTPRELPKNYLKLCSLVYQAFKRGNSQALQHVPVMISYQRSEKLESLERAFAL